MLVSLFAFTANIQTKLALLETKVDYLISGQLRPPPSDTVKK